jgi:hypothetical protein
MSSMMSNVIYMAKRKIRSHSINSKLEIEKTLARSRTKYYFEIRIGLASFF